MRPFPRPILHGRAFPQRHFEGFPAHDNAHGVSVGVQNGIVDMLFGGNGLGHQLRLVAVKDDRQTHPELLPWRDGWRHWGSCSLHNMQPIRTFQYKRSQLERIFQYKLSQYKLFSQKGHSSKEKVPNIQSKRTFQYQIFSQKGYSSTKKVPNILSKGIFHYESFTPSGPPGRQARRGHPPRGRRASFPEHRPACCGSNTYKEGRKEGG
jgi:hypothetical protein